MQPYQFFFPLGLLYALWGVLVWGFFAFAGIPYPGLLHSNLMVGGFLFSFATGFLMTAVPKFTGSEPAGKWELGAALTVVLGYGAVVALNTSELRVSLAGLAILGFLSYFCGRRWLRRTYSPPETFLLVGVGLLIGLVGSALHLGSEVGVLRPEIGAAGRSFVQRDVMFCFLTGIGGRLISALLGWAAPPVQISKPSDKVAKKKFPVVVVLAGLLLLGLALEVAGAPIAARFARAVVATWIGFSNWKLHKRPRIKGRLPTWLWLASWSLVAGLWVEALFPWAGVHGAHLTLISGLGLLTLMVASRVTLAHGNHDLSIEFRSRTILWVGILTFFAAISRATAPIMASGYVRHLAYSGFVFAAVILIWGVFFVPKIFVHDRGTEGADEC